MQLQLHRGTVLGWSSQAWNSLTNQTIVNGFVKCGWIDGIHDESASQSDDIPSSAFAVLKEANLLDEEIGEITGNEREFDVGRSAIGDLDE